jgi:hypothetical protein
MEYDRFMESRNYGGYQTNIGAVVSDGDYIALSGSVGTSDDWLIPRQMLHYFEYGDGTSYFSNHLMIRSEDPDATEAFLTEALGRDGFLSPEDVFDDLFAEYTSSCELVNVRTTNMGSMFRLTYDVTLKDPDREKELIDKLRCRNGNLEINVSRQATAATEL